MKVNRLVYVVAFFFGAGLISNAFARPINLNCEKQAIIMYYDDLSVNSPYLKEVDEVVKDAERYLEKRLAENRSSRQPAKLAIVLDVDETSLSNYPAIKGDDFSNLKELVNAHYHSASAPAIGPVLRLYNEALSKGVAVFFIT